MHSGWGVAVALAGPADSPEVLERRKIELVRTFTYTYRQPYHTAQKMSLKEAAEFIVETRAHARKLAVAAMEQLQEKLEGIGLKVRGCALLLASGRALPALDEILASHTLIHTADGELFRDAILYACEERRLSAQGVKERELMELASRQLRKGPEMLQRRIAELGRGLGPPWSQDEKLSTLVAWLSLASGFARNTNQSAAAKR